ncbi:MAG: alpha/beta hydrolase-fold protein [Vicinamibacterales bacterium]
MRTAISVLVGALLVGSAATSAQTPPAQGTPAPGGRGRGQTGPAVVSPEVHADRKVTVRIYAPKATEVTVTGELLNGSQPVALTRGDDGVWSATVGPLPPDIYTYAFNVDGVPTPDPRNPWLKLVASTGLTAQVEVPGEGLQYYDSKPVPHGLLQIVTYESKATGATRQAYVYTPPDYTTTTRRYPVLYLLHGGGDLDPGWSMTGRAHVIMDNLIAEKKAVPMIVVMPLARGGGSLGLGPSGMSPGIAAAGNIAPGAGRGGGPGAPPAGPASLSAFSQDLFGDLLPVIEKTFRASNRAEDRAIGGLSAGGAATINASFSRPDLFRYIVIMSAGGQNVEQSYPKFFANSAAAAKPMKLVWLGVGDADFALNGMKALDEILTKHQITHTYRVSPGYRHEWRLWRPQLYEFAQLLFRNGKKGT